MTTRSNRSACGRRPAGRSGDAHRLRGRRRRTTTCRMPSNIGVVGAPTDDGGGSGGRGYRAWLAAWRRTTRPEPVPGTLRSSPSSCVSEAILRHRAELGDPCVGFVAVLWEDPAREYDPRRSSVTQVTEEDAVAGRRLPGRRRDRALERRTRRVAGRRRHPSRRGRQPTRPDGWRPGATWPWAWAATRSSS